MFKKLFFCLIIAHTAINTAEKATVRSLVHFYNVSYNTAAKCLATGDVALTQKAAELTKKYEAYVRRQDSKAKTVALAAARREKANR